MNFPIQCSCIDVQPCYTLKLPALVRSAFLSRTFGALRTFRRLGIRTNRIGHAWGDVLYAPRTDWSTGIVEMRRREEFNKEGELGLYGDPDSLEMLLPSIAKIYGLLNGFKDINRLMIPIDARADEYVGFKSANDAFETPYFDKLLQDTGCKVHIVCGMEAIACAAATLKGSIQHGYKTYFLTDCVADTLYEQDKPLSPDEVTFLVKDELRKYAGKAHFRTAEQMITELMDQPERVVAPPRRIFSIGWGQR